MWKNHGRQKKFLKIKAEKFEDFYKKNLLENYVKKWIEVYEKLCKRKEIQKDNLAMDFYNRNVLLKKYFKHLLEVKNSMKLMKEKMEEFQIRRTEIYLSIYIDLWGEKWKEKLHLNVLENKATEWRKTNLIVLYLKKLFEKYIEAIEENERTLEVIKYSDAVVLHRMFKNWKEFTALKIIKRKFLENSVEFYRSNLKRKTLEKFKKFVILKRRKNVAVIHQKNQLLLKVLKHWKVVVEENKKILSKAIDLNKERNFKILSFAFDVWKSEVRFANVNTQAAIKFYNESKLSKVFFSWRKYTHRRKAKKLHYQCNSSILQNLFIRNYLFLWWELSSCKLDLNRKLEEAKRKQAKSSKRFFFLVWYDFVGKLKRIRQAEEYFPDLRSTILLEQYTIQLLESLRLRRTLKEKEELAKKKEENHLKKKYLNKWIYFVERRRETILESVYAEKKKESLQNRVKIVSGTQDKYSRRQPIIPDFLKSEFRFDETDVVEGKIANFHNSGMNSFRLRKKQSSFSRVI